MSLRQHTFQSRPHVEVKIGMPLLNKKRMGAATWGMIGGFNSQETIDIRLTGSSVLGMDITAGNARCEISGASRVGLRGSAKNVTLNTWGASNAETADFQVDNMNVQVNGSSEATINVHNPVNINLDSGSRLTYLNNSTIGNISVSDASSLSHK